MPNLLDRDHRFAVLDQKRRARIVAAYRDHGLSFALMQERFGLSHDTLRRVLVDAGVKIR